jgi:hypothetical protein
MNLVSIVDTGHVLCEVATKLLYTILMNVIPQMVKAEN